MKKIESCQRYFEAEIIKSKLESNGIPTMLTNQNMNIIYSLYPASFAPVEVFVADEDFEKAQQILSKDITE